MYAGFSYVKACTAHSLSNCENPLILDGSMLLHKISLIFSGILFLLGCVTLGISIFFSDVLARIFIIYLTTHPTSFSDNILYVNSKNFYFLAVAELILGAVGYLYHSKKAE